nr:proteasome associated protein ECM29 [Hymenolepis microstoma]
MGSAEDNFGLLSAPYPGSIESARIGTDIERLALRISLAESDAQFENIVQKSLVYLLHCLARYEEHRKKLFELLGDIIRRLKRQHNIQLPVNDLFVSYNAPEPSTYLANFSHLYIRLGFPRLPLNEQICLLPVLFASLTENKPVVQRDVLLHLTLPIIGGVPADVRNRQELELYELPMQRRYINEFYSLVLLLPYHFERHIRFDNPGVLLPDGFNSYDYSRVAHERFSLIQDKSMLEKYKISIVQFYSRGFFPPDESILPLIFADCDTMHSVIAVANKEVRMLSVLVDWENEALLSRIFDWYLGRRREFDPKGLSEPRVPLTPVVRMKLGNFLLQSRLTLPTVLASDLVEAGVACLKYVLSFRLATRGAGNTAIAAMQYPPVAQQSLQTAQQQNMYLGDVKQNQGISPSTQQKQLQTPIAAVSQNSASSQNNTAPGVPTCSFRSGANILRRLANHGLDLMSHLLDNATSIPTEATIRALGGLIEFVYESNSDELVQPRARGFELLSRFLSREPNYLLKDPSQLPRLFDVLSEDIDADLKIAAANCLRRLAFTFQEAQRQNYPALRNQLAKLERLLFDNMERPDPVSRLVAVHFAGIIYPPDHIPTRYLILQALGDKDPKVRNEARIVFSIFLDPQIGTDIVYGRVKVPNFVDFVINNPYKKNLDLDVERLTPVVQFIRLCLLAVKGGLTSTQEKEMIYETDDEIRYRINQNVRYLLSLSDQSSTSAASSGKGGAESVIGSTDAITVPNQDQARESVLRFFHLIHHVIFSKCQSSWDLPEFPNLMEEVVVNNAKALREEGKEVLSLLMNSLLGTSRGANCRHACASIVATFTMENQTQDALQVALGMLDKIPKPSGNNTVNVDIETSHQIQGMVLGAAYLLKHLHDKYSSRSNGALGTNNIAVNSNDTPSCGKSKKSKKQDQKNKQQQLQGNLTEALEKFLKIIDPFFVRPIYLMDKPLGGYKDKATQQQDKGDRVVVRYTTPTLAQNTVTALLESLIVLGQAGCFANLPAGASVPEIESTGPLPPCGESKANLVARIVLYLTLPPSPAVTKAAEAGSGNGGSSNEDLLPPMPGHQCVWFAALRTLAFLCTGEQPESDSKVSTHPHLMYIIEAMSKMVTLNDPALQLAVGGAMADALLGDASPYKGLWYERTYPQYVPQVAAEAVATSPAGKWLSERFTTVLTHKPGQLKPPPTALAVAIWALSMARRFTPPPTTLFPPQLFINLLAENHEALQCMAASILGLMYDRSDETTRKTLVDSLNKSILDSKRPNPVFRELCHLAHQIGREDMTLSLLVLATTTNPTSTFSSPISLDTTSTAGSNSLATQYIALCSMACVGLVRRLGRSLAPALPRLVPRIFIRRYDMARPKMRAAMHKIWLALILFATPNAASAASSANAGSSLAAVASSACSSTAGKPEKSTASPTNIAATWESGNLATISINTLASELIDANFNAILCEIKAKLGLTSTTKTTKSPASPSSSSSTAPDPNLRDACCHAVVALTEHPSAYKQFAAHLPSLLSGLLAIVDAEKTDDDAGVDGGANSINEAVLKPPSPAEKAASAIQKLMIRALDDPSCREVATGLLPRLLPILISRTISTNFSMAPPHRDISESHSLSVDLLLAVSRLANPASLKHALPHLTLVGLHTMAYLNPARVVSVMRPFMGSIQHQHQSWHPTSGTNIPIAKETQMAEVLRLCVRLMDDSALEVLIVPFIDLIRAGSGIVGSGGSSAGGGSRGVLANSAAAVATATCTFLSLLAHASAPSYSMPTTNTAASSRHVKKDESNSGESDVSKPRSAVSAALSQHTGKLMAAILGALPTAGRHLDSLGRMTVQEEMAQALALLMRFSKDSSVAKVFQRVCSWFLETGTPSGSVGGGNHIAAASASNQWACVRVMHAIARFCPDLIQSHLGLTLPMIVINALGEDVLKLNSFSNDMFGGEPLSTSLTSLPFTPATAVFDDDAVEELTQRRALWQEIMSETHPSGRVEDFVAGMMSNNVISQIDPSFTSVIYSIIDLFRQPILSNFISTLSEALIKSPSWLVRNQAALTLLFFVYVVDAMPIYPINVTQTVKLADTAEKPTGSCESGSGGPDKNESGDGIDGVGEVKGEADKQQQEEDEEPEQNDDDDDSEENEDEDDYDDGEGGGAVFTFIVWCDLVKLLIAALRDTGTWSGKVYLLRAMRVLSVITAKNNFVMKNLPIADELWSTLARETRSGRTEHAGVAYQIEAFYALAFFGEYSMRDATGLTEFDEAGKVKDDRLTRLLHIIFPNGIPANAFEGGEQQSSKKSKQHQTEYTVSKELPELELELAIIAVGLMWPVNANEDIHNNRLVDTLRHLVYLLSQGGWRIQCAALKSIYNLLSKARITGEELLRRVPEKGGKQIEILGIKELVNKLKLFADNTKAPILRDQVLDTIKVLMKYPEIVIVVKKQLTDTLKSWEDCEDVEMKNYASMLSKHLLEMK